MWDNLKASIASVVRTNNNQEITGANLQSVLNTIVNTVGANATFAGIATPSTNPGTPDGPVFYIACEPGVYSNFNLTLVDGLYILENKTGSWVGTQINTGAAFEALIGYYNAVLNGASITVPEATTYRLTKGGVVRLKMLAPGTTATTLTIGNATDIPIWYNGAAVSAQNTWEANEIISVFYDGTRFMASNSQGGGGKAEKIKYNNSQSGLAAKNVQEAIDKGIETLSDKFGEAELYEDNSFTESYGRGGTKTDSINNARYIGKVLDIASDYTVDRIEFDAERFASVVPQGDVTVQYGIVNGETKHLVSKSTFTVPAGHNAVDVGIAVPAHHFIVVRKTNLGVDSGGNTVKLFALSWFSGGENLAQFINGTVGETYISVGSYILRGLTVEYSYTQRDYLKAQEVRQTARRVDELGVVEETVTPTDWQRGGINATSSNAKFGQVVTNTPTAYVCSGNIDCAGSVSVKAALPTANNTTNQTLGLVFYDADGNPISGVRIKAPISGETYNDITVDTPPDAAYLRTTYFQGGTTVTLVRRTQDAIGKLYDRAEAVRSYAHSLDHFPDNADYADKVGLLKQVAKNKKLLCWFSDLHADAVRLSRILAFCKHYGIGDILFTGDLVEINHTEDIAWWAETGAQDVLIAIGNHDVWGDGEVNVTQRAVYDKFIAPYVARWGVVQPEGAAENALCYYYKDYTANTLRLIVIDDQYKPASQTEWLTNVLADAKTQGLRVIIATHGYPEATSTGTLDTPFDTNRGTPNNWYPIPQIVSAVKTFIDGGGMFVCWLTGHAHYNYARLLDGDARQLCLSVANAGLATSVRGQGYRNTEALSQDQFDILGINDTSLFVARIGCDMEFTRGKAVTMAWNYVEHKLLY